MHFSDTLGIGKGEALRFAVDPDRKILEILQLLAERYFIAVNIEKDRDQSLSAACIVDNLLRPEEVLVLHIVHYFSLKNHF